MPIVSLHRFFTFPNNHPMSSQAGEKRDRVQPSRFAGASSLCVLLLLGQSAPLLANPTGGAIVAGAATIGAAGKTLTITQSSNRAIIDWQSFSIAGGETTKFIVPTSTSATLNYVLGGNPSAIYGTLSSNGQLFLINPNGILVGPGGRIDTSSFVGSTLNANNNEFLAGGNLQFNGSSTAAVDNQGTISATSGNVFLIASQVSNEGVLSAAQGDVGLAAGTSVLLQQAGDQHLFVQSNPVGTARAVGVSNAGTIQAATAELRAAGGNAYALAINNTGAIVANGYRKINGQVYLTAGSGAVVNSGSIHARGRKHGGSVTLASQAGAVSNSGSIDVSATSRGGQGGSVTLSSPQGAAANTGAISAQGGTAGAGGSVDVTASTVDVGAGVVNTLAPGGATGMFTIDPGTLTIAPTGGYETGAQLSSALQTSDVTLNADTAVTINDSVSWTAATTLTLSTNTQGSAIAINQPISGTAGTLQIDTAYQTDQITTGAGGSVNVSAFILQNGSWVQNSATLPAFTASNNFEIQNNASFLRVTGGDGSSGNPYQITDIYGLQGLASPSKAYFTSSAVLENDIDASGTANWNGGAGWMPIGSYDGSNSSDSSTYSGVFNGQGHTINGLTINNTGLTCAGLFGDTANTATVENVNLTNASVNGQYYVGELAGVSNAAVTNCTTQGTVNGSDYVGGLLGINGGPVSGSSSAGTVDGNSGSAGIGGLVGESQFGSITNCTSSADVLTGTTNTYNIGGLVGINDATITSSSSSGMVTGHTLVGGLVGSNYGTITGSSSTSPVTGGTEVGGLVGENDGQVSSSFATGSVNGTSSTGGLVGSNTGTVSGSYSTSPVTGLNDIGGLVGSNSQLVTNSFSTGAVSGSDDSVGGLLGENTGSVVDSYTASTVTPGDGATNVGGVTGSDIGGSYTNVFWDTSTAGITLAVGTNGANNTAGIIGATTTQLMTQSYITSHSTGSPAWDFTNTWSTNSDTTLPQLIGVGGPGGSIGAGTDVLSGTAYLDAGLNASPDVLISLLFDGTVIATTTTSNSGAFTFDISPADVSAGLLLIDSADKGNTYLQSGSSATAFTGIDLWGSTLRIVADTASNSALKTVLGSYSGSGVNYTVSNANALSTKAGISLNVVSAYTLDGNLTAAGTFTAGSGSNLTGSVAATVTASAISLEGDLDDTGALTFHSTAGEIFLQDVGNAESPAIVDGLTLNSTGAIDIQSCYLTLPSGNFSANGTGYSSNSDANGEANGVNIFDSNILLSGGNVTLTGAAGYTTVEGQTLSGLGVAIGTDGNTPVEISTTGSGNITITGSASQNITCQSFIAGVDIYSDDPTSGVSNIVSVENGALNIMGTVSNDTATGPGEGQGSIVGADIASNAMVQALGSGSVSITGNTTGSTAQANSSLFQFNEGIGIEGIVDVNSGDLTLHGTAGTVNTSNSTATGSTENGTTPTSVGVAIESDNTAYYTGGLSSGNGSTVTINGTGGAIVTTGAYTGQSIGVTFGPGTVSDFGTPPEEEDVIRPAVNSSFSGSVVTITGTGGAVNAGNGTHSGDAGSDGVHLKGVISVEDGGSLTITGYGGAINASHATQSSGDNIPISSGIAEGGGGYIAGFGSSPVTLIGTGGAITAGSDTSVGSIGVNLGEDNNSGEDGTTTVSVVDGLLTIHGTGGSSPSLGAGVVFHGFNGGSVVVEAQPDNVGDGASASDTQISITGIGGTGYAGSGVITGNYVPNTGVIVADNVTITTPESISITGNNSAGSNGVTITTLKSDPTLDESPVSPQISATNLTITSSLGNVLVDGVLTVSDLLRITTPGSLDLEAGDESDSITAGNISAMAGGPITINTTVVGDGTDTFASTTGNVTLGANALLSDTGVGAAGEGVPNTLTLAAGTAPPHGKFIYNDASAGAGVITVTNGATFDLYESQSSSSTLGGITVPPTNIVSGATYPNTVLPSGNGVLYYGSGNSSTTLPNDGGGSNDVPPAVVPQEGDVQTGGLASIWGGSVNPPFSFTGGASNSTGGPSGGLAGSSGNGGNIGAGDGAQLGGGYNNIQNPVAAGALDVALGATVHNALNSALAAFGDWTDTDYNPGDQGNAGGGNGETEVGSGDVVEIGNNQVKTIPLSQAPAPLKNALGNGVRNNLSGP